MGFEIRLAKNRDLKGFFDYLDESLKNQFPEYSSNVISYLMKVDYAKKDLRQWIKKKTRQLFLAIVQRKKVGYLLASKPYGGIGFCNLLAVKPEFQGNGIASALIKFWEKQAIKDGAHKLQLWSDKRNVEFYKHRGFVLVGEIPEDTFGTSDFLFYKTLRKANEKNFLKEFLEKK